MDSTGESIQYVLILFRCVDVQQDIGIGDGQKAVKCTHQPLSRRILRRGFGHLYRHAARQQHRMAVLALKRGQECTVVARIPKEMCIRDRLKLI